VIHFLLGISEKKKEKREVQTPLKFSHNLFHSASTLKELNLFRSWKTQNHTHPNNHDKEEGKL
jgi:hypothetical protein